MRDFHPTLDRSQCQHLCGSGQAQLLHRVFAIEILVCDRCGGPRRILGAVTEPHAVRRVLAALGLAAEPPPGRPVPAA
jgi:hypothetical protein